MVDGEMSNKTFSEKEIEILSRNQYIKTVTTKGITYTDEFKRIFVAAYEKGKFPREIFEDHGFDITILGMRRVKSSCSRWRISYEKDGVLGLNDSRKGSSGRSNEKELSIEEKYSRLKVQNNLLKAENELLKKIDMMERGLGRKK